MKRAGIFIVILSVFGVVLFSWNVLLPDKKIRIYITQGMTGREIASLLKKNKLIFSETYFLLLTRFKTMGNRFKAGLYEFSANMSSWRIIKKLVSGETVRIRITILEGWREEEVASYLTGMGIVDENLFLKVVRATNSSGKLFPDTYYLTPGLSPEEIVRIMTEEFKKKFSPNWERAKSSVKLNERQILILASLIENESKKDEERPLVSAVFYNRLKKKWFLESCATVQYALGRHKSMLNYKDLRIQSPYNTYIHYGLPPGPICSPGLASLRAALQPATTDALFFVYHSSGTHTFSRYYKDHLGVQNQNKKLKKRLKKFN